MSANVPRGSGRDLSALKNSPGLRALRTDAAAIEPPPADLPLDPDEPQRDEDTPAEPSLQRSPRASYPTNGVGNRVPIADAGAKRGTIAYLPTEVKARLEIATRAAAQTYTEWFLNQFDALYDQLVEEFPPPPQRRSPLPTRTRPPRRRVGLGPSTMLQLRLTTAELAAIDERRAQLGGPSRSEFVTRIIELGIEKST
jgi:hypothetical protein